MLPYLSKGACQQVDNTYGITQMVGCSAVCGLSYTNNIERIKQHLFTELFLVKISLHSSEQTLLVERVINSYSASRDN